MTTDQTKALEILLEIGGNLDYEAQFAPLLRFVLSGSTDTEEPELEQEQEETEGTQAKISICDEGGYVVAYCNRCGKEIMRGSWRYDWMNDFVKKNAKQAEKCPNCGAKFLHE